MLAIAAMLPLVCGLEPIRCEAPVDEVRLQLENRLALELDSLAQSVPLTDAARHQIRVETGDILAAEAKRLAKIVPSGSLSLGPAAIPLPEVLRRKFLSVAAATLGTQLPPAYVTDIRLRATFERALLQSGLLASVDSICFLSEAESVRIKKAIQELVAAGRVVPAMVLPFGPDLPKPGATEFLPILGRPRFELWRKHSVGIMREDRVSDQPSHGTDVKALRSIVSVRLEVLSEFLELTPAQIQRASLASKGAVQRAVESAPDAVVQDLVGASLDRWRGIMATSLTPAQAERLNKLLADKARIRREYEARTLVWLLQFKRGSSLRLSGKQQASLCAIFEESLRAGGYVRTWECLGPVDDARYISAVGQMNFDELRPLLEKLRSVSSSPP